MNNLLNKLALGTVQFGLDYGINNPVGKPSREKSLAMIDFAYEKGVRIFDTANAYGEAEEILGEFTKSRGLAGKIKIITKLNADITGEPPDKIEKIITKNLAESLKRLGSEYVDGYLLHNPEHVREDKIVNILHGFKKQGLVRNIGVSIYEEADAIHAAKIKEIDYIQVPYNIFDQRLDKTDFFKLAKRNGKTVFARSTYLQGLFFMPEEKIPQALAAAKIYLSKLDKIIGKYDLTRQQAALRFSLSNESIDYVVLGVDDMNQLAECIDIAKQDIYYGKCADELRIEFADTDKKIISPNLWGK